MKHIYESIIGKRGTSTNEFMSAIYKDPNKVFIIYPIDINDTNAISDAIEDLNITGIEEAEFKKSPGDGVFVGTGKVFQKLHTDQAIDCDIYVFIAPTTTKNARMWIERNIDWESDFLRHLDRFSLIFSGEIKI